MNTQTEAEVPAFNFGDLKLKGFKVHEISSPVNSSLSYGRRDFYKIVLATGDKTICYGDQTIEINDTFLFFANPTYPILLFIVPWKKKAMPVFLLKLLSQAVNGRNFCKIPHYFALTGHP